MYNELTPNYVLRKVNLIMAKFCTKCGAALEDAATSCPSCGMTFPAAAPADKKPEQVVADLGKKITGAIDNVTTGEAFKNMTAEKKQKYLKFGIIGAAGVVALIVLIVVISLIANNTGYKGTLKKAMKAIDKVDGEAWVDLYSEYVYYERPEFLADQDDQDFDRDDKTEDLIESAEDNLLKAVDRYFNEKAGRGYKFDYKIKEVYEPESYEYDEYFEKYDVVEYDEDGEEDVVLTPEDCWKKIMVAEIELIGKGKKEKSLDIELVLAKEKKSGWVIVDYNLD